MPEATNSLHEFIVEHADDLLAELVPLASAMAQAALRDNHPLYRAREADCLELLGDLCPHKLHALLIVAASELALLDWQPGEAARR